MIVVQATLGAFSTSRGRAGLLEPTPVEPAESTVSAAPTEADSGVAGAPDEAPGTSPPLPILSIGTMTRSGVPAVESDELESDQVETDNPGSDLIETDNPGSDLIETDNPGSDLIETDDADPAQSDCSIIHRLPVGFPRSPAMTGKPDIAWTISMKPTKATLSPGHRGIGHPAADVAVWRERVGIEPTPDVISARQKDLKSSEPTRTRSLPINFTSRRL